MNDRHVPLVQSRSEQELFLRLCQARAESRYFAGMAAVLAVIAVLLGLWRAS